MRTLYTRIIAFVVFFLFVSLVADAQKRWDGGAGTTNWGDANNWNPNGVPGSGDDVILDLGITIQMSSNNPAVRTLRITNNVNVTLISSGGGRTLTINESGSSIDAGSSLTLQGSTGSGTRNMGIVFAGTNRTIQIDGTLVLTDVGEGTFYNATNSITTVAGTLRNTDGGGTITSTASNLVFAATGTYDHNINGGTLPTANWNGGSTCLVTGITNTVPGGLGQSFGNFTWNCTGQTADISFAQELTDIGGNLTVQSTGSGSVRLVNGGGNGTVTVAGNFLQSGGTFFVCGTSSSSNLTLDVNGTFQVSSGTFNINGQSGTGTVRVAGNFTHSGGTITETGSGTSNIIFYGNTPQTYISSGTVSNTINYTVAANAVLQMDAGTTVLGAGSNGTFTLSSGATLGIRATDGIAISGTSGQIRVTGTRTFTAGANYIYNGTAPQTTGTGLSQNTPANVTIQNAAGVTLSNATTISGLLNMVSGTLNMANTNLTVGALTGTGNLTHSSGTAGARTLTIGSNNASTSYAGVISNGTSSSVALIKNGSGTLTFTGANSYTGTTTINAGVLQLGAAGVLSNTSNVDLNGGTLRTGAAAGFAETVGSLDLSANSTIHLGTGNHDLNFAASNSVTWTGGQILTITGWLGGYNGTSGTAGRIFFGTTNGGLTSSQVQQIRFFDGTNNIPAIILGTGEVVPNTPPPTNLSYPTPNILPRGVAISNLTPTVTGTVSSYAISPALPAGLNFNTSTGVISGTPSVNSPLATYTVTATNATGSTSFGLQISVSSTFYARASGNWNSNTTWSFTSGGGAVPTGVFPGAGDIVFISEAGNDRTVTIPASFSAACGTLNIGTTGNTGQGVLTFAAASSSLVVDGSVIMNRANGTATSEINVNAGSMTVNGSVTLANSSGSSTSTSRINEINISTGSLIIGGNLSFNGQVAQQSQILFSGAGTLSLSGNFVLTNGAGTLTPSTGTVIFNGANQSVPDVSSISYHHLTLAGTGIKSLANATAATGNVTVQTGITLQTNNNTLSIGGNFVNNGTFTAGSSRIVLTGGNTQSIAGFSTTGEFEVDKSGGTATLQTAVSVGTLTLTAGDLSLGSGLVHTISGSLNRDGGNLLGGSSTLQISGTTSGTSGSFIPGTSTVEWNGNSAQTVAGFDYYNLTLSGSGAKSFTGTTRIANVFNPGSFTTATSGTTIVFNGSGSQTIPVFNYANLSSTGSGARILASSGVIGISGTFTPGSNSYTVTGSTISFNGGTQTIPAFTYHHLVRNSSGTSYATLSGNITVLGNLTNTAGNLRFNNSGTVRTITIQGNYLQSAGAVDLADDNATTTINLGGDFTVDGGTLTTSTENQSVANGTFIFTGSSPQNFTVAVPTDITYVNFTVNAGATLRLNSNLHLRRNDVVVWRSRVDVNNGGTFDASSFTVFSDGTNAAIFNLNAGANFITANPNGVTGTNASINTSGLTTTLSTAANYTFNAAAAQVTTGLPAQANNITISNAAGVTLSGTSLTITGTLLLESGEFALAGRTMTFINGNTPIQRVSGTVSTSNTTHFVFGTAGNTGGADFTLPGGLFSSAPILNQLTINRTNPLRAGTNDLLINGSLNLTAGVFDIAGQTLTFQNGNTPIVRTAGTITTNAATSLVFGSAGNQGGAAFTIPNNTFGASPVSLLDVRVNRTNALVWGNQDLTINGTLTLTTGVVDVSGRTLTFQNGNVPIDRLNGTLTTSTGTSLVFGTAGNQGGNAFTFPNNVFTAAPVLNQLVLNRTNEIELSNQDITIGTTLQLTSGVLDAGSQNVILNATASINGGSNASHVKGNLRRSLPAGNNGVLFAVGDGNVYAPVVFTPAGTVTAGGQIAIQSIAGDPANIGSSGINNNLSVNRHWRVAAVTPVPGMSSYQLQLSYAVGDNDAGTTPADYQLRIFDAADARWYLVLPAGTPSATTATSTPIAANRFGDVVVGNSTGTISIQTEPGDQTVCAPNGTSFTVVSNSVPTPTIRWQVNSGGVFTDITAANQTNGTTYSGFNSATLTLTGSSLDMNGYAYRAVLSNVNGQITTRNAQLFVNAVLTPGVTLTILNNGGGATICAGTNLVFKAIAANTGGGTVTYDFRVNGQTVQNGTADEFSSSTLSNNDVVSCFITIANGSCLTTTLANSDATNTSRTIQVLNPSVSISANTGTTICAGTTVTFTATPQQTGTIAVGYTFRVNGISQQSGSSNQFMIASLQQNDIVTCDLQIQGGSCTGTTVNSNSVVMTVLANLNPTVTLSASATTICAGTSVTFTAVASNTGGGTVTYDFKVNGISQQNSTNPQWVVSNLQQGASVTCDVVVTGGTCTAANASSNTISMTVVPRPTVTLSAAPGTAVCAATNVVFTANANQLNGATATYTFFRNGINVQSGSQPTYTATGFNHNDQVYCELLVGSGTCSGASVNSNVVTLTVVSGFTPTVTLSVSPGTTINSGGLATFTAVASNTGGGTITYVFRQNNIVRQSGPSSIFSTNTLTNGSVITCDISISGGVCLTTTTAVSNSITMTVLGSGPLADYVWTGAVSTNWNTDDNWSTNEAPPAGASILIQPGSARYPLVNSGTISVDQLTILAGGSLTVTNNATLQVAGALQLTGALNVTQATLELNGSSPQVLSGSNLVNGTVQHLKISNQVTLTSLLQVTREVSFGNVNNRTLTTGGFLVLKSTASGKAIVSDLTNSNVNSGNTISGLVTVEHFIPAGRKWRGLAAPLRGAANNSIFDNWQNGGVEAAGTGVLLWSPTGTGAAGNGFSLNQNTGASANIRGFSINTFNTPTNTKTTPLFTASGPRPYLVFVTDQYYSNLTQGNMWQGARATTLKARGELNTGSYSLNGMASGLNMIANPYAADIDFATIGKGNINNQFWVWDPRLFGFSGFGGYVYTSNSGSGYVSAPLGGSYSGNSSMIPSGGAFWVRVNDGFTGTLNFRETDKTNGAASLFRSRTTVNTDPIIRANLQHPTAAQIYDGVAAVFNTQSSNQDDPADVRKFGIGAENISFRRQNGDWAIDFRQPVAARDTLYLRLHNLRADTYRLELSAANFTNAGAVTAILQDLYLNTETTLGLNTTQQYAFTVVANTPASTGDRFRIVFRPGTVTPVSSINRDGGRLQLYPNPFVRGGEGQVSFTNLRAGKYAIRFFDLAGQQVATVQVVHGGGNGRQSFPLPGVLAAGVYVAEVTHESGSFKEQFTITIQ